MKTICSKIAIVVILLSQQSLWAQSTYSSTIDSLKNFDEKKYQQLFLQQHPHQASLYEEYIKAKKQDFIRETYYSSSRGISVLPSVQTACTNMNFESGDLTGWTGTTGFNPLYDTQGCCTSSGGAQAITSGAGTDPCGGFPVVFPGGNFSVQIGNNAVNGVADRLEQTFSVTQANANYTYNYAVVLEEPGHSPADQPSFQIEMLDALGVQIPCTFYQVSAGQGIPGFMNSTNCNGVIYKPWTTVSVDLSSYIGQDVTIRFTTYDCALGGHFAYAYIDGSCLAYTITQSDSLCVGSTTQICAPPGFQNYTWSGPGIVNQNANCITVSNPGMYSVQLTTVTGCQTPVINYHVINHPTPQANFNAIGGNNTCDLTVAFHNTSSVSNTNQLSCMWDFGDGTTSFMEQPTHTYLSYGTYTVALVVTAIQTGCRDTQTRVIVIDNPPSPVFTATGACAGTTVNFTNQTQNLPGNETWLWNFGDNTTSTQQNTSHLYPVAGTYNVTLSVTTSNGCVASTSGTVIVNTLPFVNFTSTSVCAGQLTTLNDASSIAGGTINAWQWDFNGDGQIDNTTQNPTHNFVTAGNHIVSLTATSSLGCSGTFSSMITVYPNPVAAFSVSNTCVNVAAAFQNTSTIAFPSQIQSYNWSFGDTASSILANPNHQYANAGTYNVSLTATSINGCVNTFNYSIIIYPSPVAAFATIPVCVTQATLFTDQSNVSGGTIVARNWDFNNDGTIDATTANPSYTYPLAGQYNAKLQAISNNGCSNQTINQVIVHHNPVAHFVSQSSCLGVPTIYMDNSSSVDGAIVSYSWDYVSDGTIDNVSANPMVTFPNFGTYLTTLEVQTEYGCEASFQKPIYINPVPIVQFTASEVSGCPPLCVNFTNGTNIPYGNIAYYNWTIGNQNTTSTQVNPSACFETGVHDVILTAVSDSGCVATKTLQAMISVHPVPKADFSIVGESLDVLNPEVEIVNHSAGASQLSYSVSDGFTTQLTDFLHLFNSENPQVYTITQYVQNVYGCRDSVTKDLEIKPVFTFYIPNAFSPNNDGKNDYFKGEGIGIDEYRFWIFDRWGNLIFYSKNIDEKWDGKVQNKSGELVMQDVYVWKVHIKDVFTKLHNYHGTVTVVK